MDDYISIETRLPIDGEKVQMQFKCDNEIRICRGFFYLNGGEPVFASFGSQVTDVVAWKHCNSNMGFS